MNENIITAVNKQQTRTIKLLLMDISTITPHNPLLSNSSSSFRVQYLPANRVPNRKTTARLKQAALWLLGRLVVAET